MGQNLIVMRFPAAVRASQALAELQAASAAGRLQLLQAALLQRDSRGLTLAGPDGQRLLETAQGNAPDALAMDDGAATLLARVREFSEREVDGLAREMGVELLRRPLPPAPGVAGAA